MIWTRHSVLVASVVLLLLIIVAGSRMIGAPEPTPAAGGDSPLAIHPLARRVAAPMVPTVTPIPATPVPAEEIVASAAIARAATAMRPATPAPTPSVGAAVQIGEPIRLLIPAIGVDAAVQSVGLDEQGQMGVPSNYEDVAWYALGARPGAPGNAVIDGHLDSTMGPAVFYRLRELHPGDEIVVLTDDGTELRFIVASVESLMTADAPLDRIFGPSSEPRLNLITCDGSFDRDARQYDRRLVVYAVRAAIA